MWTGCGSFSVIDGRGHPANDLPRRDVEGIDHLIDAVDVARRMLLPDFDAAGIDQLDGVALGRAQQPGDERLQPLRLAVAGSPS